MRPKIEGRAEDIVGLFLERGIYKTQAEVIEASLELLLDKRMEFEASISQDENGVDDYLTDLQLNAVESAADVKAG